MAGPVFSNQGEVSVKYQYPLVMSQNANFQCEKQTKQNKSRASVISVDLTDSLWRKFWIIWDLSHSPVQKDSKIYKPLANVDKEDG